MGASLHRDLVRGWQDYRGRQGTETVWGPVLSALLFWVKASLETVHEPWLSELNCCCQWGNPKPDISELLRVSHSAFTALLHAKHLHIDKKIGINALNNPLTQKCPYLSKWTGTSEIWKVPSKYHPTWLSTGEGRMADFTFSFSLLSWEHCACLLQRAWDFVIMAIVWKLKIGKYCSPPSVH